MTGLRGYLDRAPAFRRLRALFRRTERQGCALVRDTRGAGVVEFGLIVPAMLLVACALGELAAALDTTRKVGQFTRTIADLIGRSNVDDAKPVFDAAAVIMQPYDSSKAQIRVSAMGVYKVSGTFYSVVCSSAAQNTTPRPRFEYGKSSLSEVTQAPASFQYDGARYIYAEVTLPYTPKLGSVFFKWAYGSTPITFSEKITWPERSDEIVLPGCKECS